MNIAARRQFDWLSAILSGLASALALDGNDNFWLAWIALVPLLCAVCRSGTARAFLLGCVFGAVQSCAMWNWLAAATIRMRGAPWLGILFVSALCLVWALAYGILCAYIAAVSARTENRAAQPGRVMLPLLAASGWVALEYGYGTVLETTAQIFPMAIGYSQGRHPLLIQAASITGVYGISFMIVLFNAAVSRALSRRRLTAVLPIAAAIAVCMTGSRLYVRGIVDSGKTGKTLCVAILQGNIPPWTKFDLSKSDILARRYLELGALANRENPDLIAWTEAAVPWPLREDDELVTTMLEVTAPARAFHILGATFPTQTDTNRYHNAALLVHPDGNITQQYNKRRLITFVERPVRLPLMPASGTIHPSGRTYLAGESSGRPCIQGPIGRAGMMICNENLYPSAARESARQGGEFLVLLANDAWFPEDMPVNQHFVNSLFRAVETGRFLVSANNVGISGIIAPDGTTVITGPTRIHACIAGMVERRKGWTLYVRYGDLFAGICSAVAIIGGLWLRRNDLASALKKAFFASER